MIRILPMIVRVEKRRNDVDQKEERIQKLPNAGWFTKKSGSADPSKRKSNWVYMLLKYNIDQNEDCILGLLTVAVDKKIKELIKKDELTIADLEGVGLRMLKRQYKNDVELEYHVEHFDLLNNICRRVQNLTAASTNNDFYYLVNLSTGEKYTTSLTKHFAIRYHVEVIEDMIPDRWSKKIHLYQIDALNGIHHWEDARKDFFKAEMGNRSSEKHNMKSLMKLNEVNKFCDGTLLKVRDNLLKMVNENILGRGNKRLDGRDWSKNDIKRSNEMLEKIDKTLKRRDHLRRLEEYVGGRLKTFNPHTFVRP
ncbi:hypothetical protein Tco_0146580 [Tanacetum coccineum]